METETETNADTNNLAIRADQSIEATTAYFQANSLPYLDRLFAPTLSALKDMETKLGHAPLINNIYAKLSEEITGTISLIKERDKGYAVLAALGPLCQQEGRDNVGQGRYVEPLARELNLELSSARKQICERTDRLYYQTKPTKWMISRLENLNQHSDVRQIKEMGAIVSRFLKEHAPMLDQGPVTTIDITPSGIVTGRVVYPQPTP